MMSSWGGPQWVLVTFWAMMTFGVPLLRFGLIQSGWPAEKSWTKYWGSWGAELVQRACLAAILAWGGFWG